MWKPQIYTDWQGWCESALTKSSRQHHSISGVTLGPDLGRSFQMDRERSWFCQAPKWTAGSSSRFDRTTRDWFPGHLCTCHLRWWSPGSDGRALLWTSRRRRGLVQGRGPLFLQEHSKWLGRRAWRTGITFSAERWPRHVRSPWNSCRQPGGAWPRSCRECRAHEPRWLRPIQSASGLLASGPGLVLRADRADQVKLKKQPLQLGRGWIVALPPRSVLLLSTQRAGLLLRRWRYFLPLEREPSLKIDSPSEPRTPVSPHRRAWTVSTPDWEAGAGFRMSRAQVGKLKLFYKFLFLMILSHEERRPAESFDVWWGSRCTPLHAPWLGSAFLCEDLCGNQQDIQQTHHEGRHSRPAPKRKRPTMLEHRRRRAVWPR